MGLVINKAKKETVADFINGAGVIGLLHFIGIYFYVPISKIVRSGAIGSLSELFPLNTIVAPFPVLILSIVLFYISAKLKTEGSWVANTYEELGPGTLLIILLLSVWILLPLVGTAVKAML